MTIQQFQEIYFPNRSGLFFAAMYIIYGVVACVYLSISILPESPDISTGALILFISLCSLFYVQILILRKVHNTKYHKHWLPRTAYLINIGNVNYNETHQLISRICQLEYSSKYRVMARWEHICEIDSNTREIIMLYYKHINVIFMKYEDALLCSLICDHQLPQPIDFYQWRNKELCFDYRCN